MRRRLTRSGVSPVLATLILIVIAVVAGLIVYAWVSGWMGRWLGAGGKELKIMNVWFQQGSWSSATVGKTADSGTVEYDLWSVGYRWYYIVPGSMEVYVWASDDTQLTLDESSWHLYYDGTIVGDVDYYNGKIKINYDALASASGKTFDTTHDVKVKCTWRRIELRLKNTGGVDIAITKLWVGYSQDCPWDWNSYVKFTTLPWTIKAGEEKRFYITHDWTAGKDYYFKFETDGQYLGPYGPYTATPS